MKLFFFIVFTSFVMDSLYTELHSGQCVHNVVHLVPPENVEKDVYPLLFLMMMNLNVPLPRRSVDFAVEDIQEGYIEGCKDQGMGKYQRTMKEDTADG